MGFHPTKSGFLSLGMTAVIAVALTACGATTAAKGDGGSASRQRASTTTPPPPLGAADWLATHNTQITGLANAANGWTSSASSTPTSDTEATNYQMCADVFSNNTDLGGLGVASISDPNLDNDLQSVAGDYLKLTAETNCLPYTPGRLKMTPDEDSDLTRANAALDAFEKALLTAVPGAALPSVNISTIKPQPVGTLLTVVGSGGTASVTVLDNGDQTQHNDQAIPYTTTVPDSVSEVELEAQTDDDSPSATVTCSITKPGQAPVTNTSTGAYSVVTCSA